MSEIKDKSGYLYVLAHPDLPNYYKLGQTTQHPTKRLKIHNTSFERILGKIVRLTGNPWQLIFYVPVTDARRAESATLWYDVLPRWGNLELNRGDIRGAIEDITKSTYLDQDRYSKMIKGELSSHDHEALIVQIKLSWSREGLADTSEAMVEKLKEEQRKNDKRVRDDPEEWKKSLRK